jgi:hypothetical protein
MKAQLCKPFLLKGNFIHFYLLFRSWCMFCGCTIRYWYVKQVRYAVWSATDSLWVFSNKKSQYCHRWVLYFYTIINYNILFLDKENLQWNFTYCKLIHYHCFYSTTKRHNGLNSGLNVRTNYWTWLNLITIISKIQECITRFAIKVYQLYLGLS